MMCFGVAHPDSTVTAAARTILRARRHIRLRPTLPLRHGAAQGLSLERTRSRAVAWSGQVRPTMKGRDHELAKNLNEYAPQINEPHAKARL